VKVWQKAALAAHFKGYRVTDCGRLTSPSGERMLVTGRKSDRWYPRFSVYLDDEKRSVRIPVHKFAALCFHGLRALSSQCIRHGDDDRSNFSRENLSLGSNSDNMLDRCPKHRKRIATIAGNASAAARRKEKSNV